MLEPAPRKILRSLRRVLIAAVMSVGASLGGLALVVPPAAADPTALVTPAPQAASAFWNSMGINTHLFYSDTPYADITDVVARLEQLGILHIRDGLAPNRPDEISALQQLGAAGIKSDLLVGSPGTDPAGLLGVIQSDLGNEVEAVEGPNEYATSGVGWQARLVPFQQLLYSEVKATLPGTTVVGASVGGLDLSSELGVGNIHPYPGGGMPESNISQQLQAAELTSGSAPVWATETGYHDAMNMTPGSNQPATSDAAQAVYLPRLYAAYFAAGIRRTYLYELLDEFPDPGLTNPESDFGLLDNSMNPKPQFYALERLIHAVEDAPNPVPTSLAYQIQDSDTAGDLRQLLLSRADGTWQILVWRAEEVDSDGVAADPAQPITVSLPFCASVTTQTPSSGATIQNLGVDQQFQLPVGASLQILDVTRAACPGTGASGPSGAPPSGPPTSQSAGTVSASVFSAAATASGSATTAAGSSRRGSAGQTVLAMCVPIKATTVHRKKQMARYRCAAKAMRDSSVRESKGAPRATLSSGRTIYATGYATRVKKTWRLSLDVKRKLRTGRYTLTLRYSARVRSTRTVVAIAR